jgi:GNAT superfamily N-acetyltransferase
MPSNVVVRPVAASDHAAWLPLWDAYNRFYGRAGPTALADSITRTAWTRFLDAGEPMHAFVAESDGTLLGLAHCLFHRSTTRIEPTCYLQDLYVTEATRGLGVGRRLIDAVCDKARECGAYRVYWQAHETNAVAMALYDNTAQRTGFVVYAKGL